MKFVLPGLASGFAMWAIAGLWHNLILPNVSETAEAHHEGLAIMLVAYFILAFLMTYIYSMMEKKHSSLLEGLRIGVVTGILWVFPHGLTMAAAHDTSIWYEVHNAVWHMVEQGIGGLIIGLILGPRTQKDGHNPSE